ncbi:hypothetical protein HGM15179_014819 [Zosterops borbonicus]|uniref:Uncharacterized protein n=1 Tax=Zosterops borbonicus TaxID=364589 RepID=A0A8K1G5I4_9PASS|nr:hypothetical protein HGM15179_014819 [Zosterops borbonicus]
MTERERPAKQLALPPPKTKRKGLRRERELIAENPQWSKMWPKIGSLSTPKHLMESPKNWAVVAKQKQTVIDMSNSQTQKAQGHVCDEFDGTCGMNLSDQSQSIYANIEALKEDANKLQVDDGLDWLGRLLGDWGLSGRIRNLVKIGLYVLGIIVCIVLVIPCILQCVKNLIDKSLKSVFLIEKEGGGMEIETEIIMELIEEPSILGLIKQKPQERDTEKGSLG